MPANQPATQMPPMGPHPRFLANMVGQPRPFQHRPQLPLAEQQRKATAIQMDPRPDVTLAQFAAKNKWPTPQYRGINLSGPVSDHITCRHIVV